MTYNSLSKITYWDGNAESSDVYVSKIEAYAKFMGIEDALDPVMMENCLTKSKFESIDITNPTNRSKAKQKNVHKESVAPKADIPGHRLYLDLSKVTVKSGTLEKVAINCDNWKVLVCEATGKTP